MNKFLEIVIGIVVMLVLFVGGFKLFALIDPLLGALYIFVLLFIGCALPEIQKQNAVNKINRNLD